MDHSSGKGLEIICGEGTTILGIFLESVEDRRRLQEGSVSGLPRLTSVSDPTFVSANLLNFVSSHTHMFADQLVSARILN
jgi:hypothetical protein